MNAAVYAKTLAKVYAKANANLRARAGASAVAIAKLEKKSTVRLPKELRALWRLRDGSADVFFAKPGQLTGFDFLSVAEAWKSREMFRTCASQYEGYEESHPRGPRVSPGWFQPGWLPFADFGGGSMVLMLDFSPGPRGRKGQVIAYVHDPDHIAWVAPSFEGFLSGSMKSIRSDPEELLGSY